jgi:hypothetical protein
VEHVEPNAGTGTPGKFNPDLIWEERHRRLIPIQDEVLKRRIEQLKLIGALKCQ